VVVARVVVARVVVVGRVVVVRAVVVRAAVVVVRAVVVRAVVVRSAAVVVVSTGELVASSSPPSLPEILVVVDAAVVVRALGVVLGSVGRSVGESVTRSVGTSVARSVGESVGSLGESVALLGDSVPRGESVALSASTQSSLQNSNSVSQPVWHRMPAALARLPLHREMHFEYASLQVLRQTVVCTLESAGAETAASAAPMRQADSKNARRAICVER
jgi:hypothetical protein